MKTVILVLISLFASACVTSRNYSKKSVGQFPFGATQPSPHAKDKDRVRTVTNAFNTFDF